MTVDEINMGGDLGFRAYVIHLGQGSAGRLWVCLHSDQSRARRGWLGVWSLASADVKPDKVRQLVTSLVDHVQRDGRIGPMGPFVDGHYFFDGWETWGPGVPEPLVEMSVDDVINGTTDQFQAGSYFYVDPTE